MPTTDVAELIRVDLTREERRREDNRRAFPGVAEIVDSLTAAFGPVKVLHAVENGKEIGKPQPFDGIDIDRLIPLLERAPREAAKPKKVQKP